MMLLITDSRIDGLDRSIISIIENSIVRVEAREMIEERTNQESRRSKLEIKEEKDQPTCHFLSVNLEWLENFYDDELKVWKPW